MFLHQVWDESCNQSKYNNQQYLFKILPEEQDERTFIEIGTFNYLLKKKHVLVLNAF